MIALAACGSKSAAPTPAVRVQSGSSAPTPAAPADAARATAKAPTAEQRADYKKHMKAGWALQKQEKWAEAVGEFEAALAAIDGDQRALAELGFSAMSAGDFAKARRADEQAVQVAADKKVKAAALYNLGVVLEKTSDKDGALRAYHASLALRPNKTVEQAITKLGATRATEPPFCEPGAKPCDCVVHAAFDDGLSDAADARCTPSAASPVPGFHVIHIERDIHDEKWDYLLDEHDQLAAVIGGGFMYRMGSVMDDLALDKAELKMIGGHRVLWIQTTESLDERDDNKDMPVETQHTLVTLCLPGDAKNPTRCPLRDVPIAQSRDGLSNRAAHAAETKLDLAIADDGTATLKLVSGPSDEQIDALVGPHKLW